MSIETHNVDFSPTRPSPTRPGLNDPQIEPNINQRASLFFFSLIALSLALGWRPLFATLALASRDDQYTHILLIFPLVATLIYPNWQILTAPAERDLRVGPSFLCATGLIASLQRFHAGFLTRDPQLSVSMLALVTWWVGAFILSFGRRAVRANLFPLCLLYGLVPLPQVILDVIIKMLQQGSSLAAYLLFTMAGVPAVRDGVILTIPSLTIEVAKECSSIRSSSMLLITTMAITQLLLTSPWRKALVIALAVPLSVAKNGLRIFTIAMLGTRVNPGFLTGRLHHQGGIVFFLVSLVAIYGTIWPLRRSEHSALSLSGKAGQLQCGHIQSLTAL